MNRFKLNNLKLLKLSPAEEAVDYKLVYPDTQEDINELLHIKDRNHFKIAVINKGYTFKVAGIEFKYKNNK